MSKSHRLSTPTSDAPQQTSPNSAKQRAPYQRPALEYHGVYHILTGASLGGPGEGVLSFSNPFNLINKV